MTFVFPRMAKDPRFERLPCMHKGTYADNCIVNRIQQVRLLILFFCLNLNISWTCFLFQGCISYEKVVFGLLLLLPVAKT